MKKLTIATRGSKLALWQSNHIKNILENHFGIEVELNVIKTTGDKILDTPLAKIGGKGLFTKEIEEAMLKGEAQLSVHSLKDFPIDFPDELKLSAITKREDVRDSLLSEKYDSIDSLPQGAVVGTTSLRRKMQILKYRSDLVIKDLRGNVDTRIAKLKNGEFDAIILAQAGLNRLGIVDSVRYATPIDVDIMIPAMGQASLAIETINDERVLEFVKILNDEKAYIETRVERDFIAKLNGGCQVPIGVNAVLDGDKIEVCAIIGYPDGSKMLKESLVDSKSNFENLGVRLADILIKQGARELLDEALNLA
jgi:hydroxymethylbilane synthase